MNDINSIIHTIRPGDTLYNLAMQYGTTVQNIIDIPPPRRYNGGQTARGRHFGPALEKAGAC